MRILVTGSRDWNDWRTLSHALLTTWDYERITVVHGACPTGADEMADWVARHLMPQLEVLCVDVETHPADWDKHGRKAGPIRNAEMVSLGADVCLAFIGPCTSPRCNIEGEHASHGASGCADLAASAGIPVRRFLA